MTNEGTTELFGFRPVYPGAKVYRAAIFISPDQMPACAEAAAFLSQSAELLVKQLGGSFKGSGELNLTVELSEPDPNNGAVGELEDAAFERREFIGGAYGTPRVS